jgi:hypothetical protein
MHVNFNPILRLLKDRHQVNLVIIFQKASETPDTVHDRKHIARSAVHDWHSFIDQADNE